MAEANSEHAARVAQYRAGLPSVGVDVVDIAEFTELLQQPGTTFSEVFTAAERRIARRRSGHGTSLETHLAGRWAAKEAALKAIEQACFGLPPLLADVAFDEIEIIADRWGRVSVGIRGELKAAVEQTFGAVQWRLSISHDGPVAIAYAQFLMGPA